MSSAATRPGLVATIGRPLDAWFDRERDGRAVAILLLLFVAVWTIFHVVSRASVDLNPDLTEAYAWGRHPAAGYYKHPPLAALMAAVWFAIFPAADWSFDLLAMVNAAIALFAVDRIAKLYLSGDKRLLVLLLLLLMPFYQFHGQRFGANAVLLATWPIATYCFLRAFRTRGLGWSVAAGAAAAVAMLGKYYSVYLIGAFALAIVLHPARWTYLRSPSPWISATAGLIVLAPHLLWLTTAAFTPFEYAYAAHGRSTPGAIIGSIGTYLLGGLSYVALPLAVYAMAVRPSGPLLAQTVWPSDPDRRMVAVLLAALLLLPALSAPFVGIELTSLWTMQSWFLLPIVLLMPEAAIVPRSRAVSVAALVAAISAFALLAMAPAFAWLRHVHGSKHGEAYHRLLSDEIMREWHRYTDRPLTIVMGSGVEAITFYSPDHPDAVPDFNLNVAPWVTPERLRREGYVVMCDNPICLDETNRRAAQPHAVRREYQLSRRYLGREGPPSVRFIVVVVPPAPPGDGPK